MPHVTLRYERVKLYEEVWAEAVTTVAKRYGISDVALRKICKKLAVPVPPLGYWARVAAGRKPPTPLLPKCQTLCDHAAGNYRILTTMAAQLLSAAVQREAPQLDEKLYFDVFAEPKTTAAAKPRTQPQR